MQIYGINFICNTLKNTNLVPSSLKWIISGILKSLDGKIQMNLS